ncbi:MAG: hypothetical protein M1835_003963 [Candelina submexicana]|nr:MAG: hypothetical protein M1835_003963 [Candelina submexicana]
MDLLRDWLGLAIEEGIYTALQWKEHGSIRARADTRIVYEEAGATFRVLPKERGRPVQVLNFTTFEDPYQATLSDSFTSIEATFASGAAEGFTAQQGRRLTKETGGSVLNIKKYEILVEAQDPDAPHVSLLVQDFDHLGCDGSGTFGHPRNIGSRKRVRALLHDIYCQKNKVEGSVVSDNDNLETVSSARSRPVEMPGSDTGDGGGGQPVSQMDFATQLPPMKTRTKLTMDRQPSLSRKHRKVTSRGNTSKEPGPDIRPDDVMGLLGKTALDGKVKAKVRNGSGSVDMESKKEGRASGKFGLGRHAGEEHPLATLEEVKKLHTKESPRKHSSKAKQQKAFRPTAAVGTYHDEKHITAESARPLRATPSGLSSRSVGSEKAKDDIAISKGSKGEGEGGEDWLIHTIEIPKILDSGEQEGDSEDDPWKGMTRISQRDTKIPKEQQALLDRKDCWIPPESGQRGPIANIPIAILKSLDALVDQREKGKVSVEPEPQLPEMKSSQASGIPSQSDSEATRPRGDDSESELSWSTSPTPPLRALLPPNSSLPGSPKPAAKVTHQSGVRETVNHHFRSPSSGSDISVSAHVASSSPPYDDHHDLERSNANSTANASDKTNQQTYSKTEGRSPASIDNERTELGRSVQSGTDLHVDESHSESESIPPAYGDKSSDIGIAATARKPHADVVPSTAPSKESPTVQVKRTPHLSGETAKVNSARAKDVVTLHSSQSSERVGLASDDDDEHLNVNTSSNQVIPGTYDKPHMALQEGGVGFGSDGAQDFAVQDHDDAMVDQQIHAEIQSYSQRSLSQSPSKSTLFAPDVSESQRPQPDRPIEGSQKLPSADTASTSTLGRNSPAIRSETKRKVSDAQYLSPNVTKRRKQFKAPLSFNFSQENRKTQDSSRIGQRYRREFMSGLSTAGTRSEAPEALKAVEETAAPMHVLDETLPSRNEMPQEFADSSVTPESVGSLTLQATQKTHPHEQTSNSPNEVKAIGIGVETHGGPASAGQAPDTSIMGRHNPLPQLDAISITPRDPVHVEPAGYLANSVMARFKAAYPDYTGELSHFRTMCSRIEKLLAEDRMEHRSLWDDFVGRHRTDYKRYVVECTEGGEDPLPYEKFYRDHIDEPKYTKRILSPTTLKEALHSEVETVNRSERRVYDASKDHQSALKSTARATSALQLVDLTSDEAPPVSPNVELYDTSHELGPVATGARKETENEGISPRQFPWNTSHDRSPESHEPQADIPGASPKELNPRELGEITQMKDLKSHPAKLPHSRNAPPRTPGSAATARAAGESAGLEHHRKAVNSNSPRVSRASAKLDPPEKPSSSRRQRLSPTNSGPDKSDSAHSSMAIWLEKNKTRPAPQATEEPTDELWWQEKNTPFKEFARAYAGLKSVNGTLGTVDEAGIVRAKPRRYDILSWRL